MFPTVPPPKQRLLVFAPLPELGNVKPQLAAEVGEERALAIYESMLRNLLQQLGTSTSELEIEIFWPPTESANGESLRRAFGSHSVAIQTGATLGDRLSMAMSERFFFHRTEKIVIVGADDPFLTRELIDRAFALLDSVEYVLGPSRGGNYYLMGCRALSFNPSVFADIEWNASTVLAATLQRIATLGRTVALLPEHYDLDTAADLERYVAEGHLAP